PQTLGGTYFGGREPRRRRSASHKAWHPTWNRTAARLSVYCGSYSVKRMALPHAAHKRPPPRQIQVFTGAPSGSEPAVTFFRTRSASNFGTGSSRRRMNLVPDDARRNVIRRYTRSPHRDEQKDGRGRQEFRGGATKLGPRGSRIWCPILVQSRLLPRLSVG